VEHGLGETDALAVALESVSMGWRRTSARKQSWSARSTAAYCATASPGKRTAAMKARNSSTVISG
jgi:hypothetical protein